MDLLLEKTVLKSWFKCHGLFHFLSIHKPIKRALPFYLITCPLFWEVHTEKGSLCVAHDVIIVTKPYGKCLVKDKKILLHHTNLTYN